MKNISSLYRQQFCRSTCGWFEATGCVSLQHTKMSSLDKSIQDCSTAAVPSTHGFWKPIKDRPYDVIRPSLQSDIEDVLPGAVRRQPQSADVDESGDDGSAARPRPVEERRLAAGVDGGRVEPEGRTAVEQVDRGGLVAGPRRLRGGSARNCRDGV